MRVIYRAKPSRAPSLPKWKIKMKKSAMRIYPVHRQSHRKEIKFPHFSRPICSLLIPDMPTYHLRFQFPPWRFKTQTFRDLLLAPHADQVKAPQLGSDRRASLKLPHYMPCGEGMRREITIKPGWISNTSLRSADTKVLFPNSPRQKQKRSL